ncbi:NUDIX domain-containing protein [Streptomyces laurentii]|uniref:NUDIX domain-containing protein n=1 Tax=Streptomyces laurentii TaxID=39478 RepID=UPI0033FCA52E
MTQQGIVVAVVVHEHRVLLVRGQAGEGEPFWRFPVGPVEAGQTPEGAAVRAAWAGAGLAVTAVRLLGERTHPQTGQDMAYIACVPESLVSEERPDGGVVWAGRDAIERYVPYGELFAPVREHLDAALRAP